MRKSEAIPLMESVRAVVEWEYPISFAAACDRALEALEHDFEWTPCSEKLPKEPFGCLVTIEETNPITGNFYTCLLPYFVGYDGEQWNDENGDKCPYEIIAWMPLPNAYEEEVFK